MTTDVKTNVIKRNGKEVSFDVSKIVNAITKQMPVWIIFIS